MVPIIKKAVGEDEEKGGVNGWAVLSLTCGVHETRDRLVGRLDTFAIICGLLITVTLAMVLEEEKRSGARREERQWEGKGPTG
jgi:hypothetical protein